MTEQDISKMDRRLRRYLLLIILVSIVLTPVSNPDLWWQLSRGRVVASDLTPPGPVLTAGTSVAEADWLGGLPFYLTYQLAGFSGLMLLKFAAVGLLFYLLLKRYEEQLNWTAFFIVVLSLLTAGSALQPTPRLLDCWFLFLTWLLTERWCRAPVGKKLLPILLVLVCWANCAPLCLLGIAVVTLVPWLPGTKTVDGLHFRKASLLVCASLLALMITPRGWFTPYDSFIQVLPVLFYQGNLLALTVWHPTFQNGATMEVVGWGILTGGTALFLICSSTGWRDMVALLVFAIPGWISYDNLAPCTIGVALLVCQSLRAHRLPAPFLNVKQLIPPAAGRVILILGTFLLSWQSASGNLPGQPQRLGWGIAPELDITLLNQIIGPLNYEGTGQCMGKASTGMLCWIKPDRKIQPVRTLRQALLQGLLLEELSLNEELSSGWEFQHPRADGSWGGWWVRLKKRNCQLLLIPNGDVRTIRALFESRWQPMSVDASVIPFGWSGKIISSPKIIELLSDKVFLDRGEWTYSLPAPSGTPECSDWWGTLTGLPNLRPALLQAKTFRAMKLYTAALRVLHPLLQHYHSPEVIHEFQLCQKELAYQEKLETGASSQFRLLAYDLTNREADFPLNQSGLTTDSNRSEPVERSTAFQSAIQNYARGEWATAVSELSAADSETLYAKAQILLESGDTGQSAAFFQELIQRFPKDRLAVPSQVMLDSIQ